MTPSKKRRAAWKLTRGERNVNAKLTNGMARAIRRAYQPRRFIHTYPKDGRRYFSMPYLAEIYGVSVSTIWKVIHKISYKESKISHDILSVHEIITDNLYV